ncbi:hypothetical protein AVEN_10811-1 [Araneus ventricosus]|uniref:Uncharacterized protein n=1 Tax=Araneus ventricosus TaxID=182803 RepID=A0A4Y2SG67_ARAVE|nr:hypothetical protein AVEN_10811-1 [Araneus ventricosus]
MQVLWLGRGFAAVKHGGLSATLVASHDLTQTWRPFYDLATSLAGTLYDNRLSRKCNFSRYLLGAEICDFREKKFCVTSRPIERVYVIAFDLGGGCSTRISLEECLLSSIHKGASKLLDAER